MKTTDFVTLAYLFLSILRAIANSKAHFDMKKPLFTLAWFPPAQIAGMVAVAYGFHGLLSYTDPSGGEADADTGDL